MGQDIQNHKIVDHLYFHIPFCVKKCNYCSFFSKNKSLNFIDKYFKYIAKEIELFKKSYCLKPKTVYFGGGTPSSVPFNFIQSVLDDLDLSSVEEVTLEVNPINVDSQFVSEVKNSPINRISMGAQSFIDKELALLGRLHTFEKIEKAFSKLRIEFENISLDLIYGLPNQTEQEVGFSLNKIIELNPEHISTYCLSLEPDVKLYSQRNLIPKDIKISKFYYTIKEKLEQNNYQHYEISNFSKKEMSSKHNSAYWKMNDYLGLGASASGFVDNKRYVNPANFDQYFSQINDNKVIPNPEIINNKKLQQEFIFLGLRTIYGINLQDFDIKFGYKLEEKNKTTIDKFSKFLQIKNNKLLLKKDGLFISNEIMSEFM